MKKQTVITYTNIISIANSRSRVAFRWWIAISRSIALMAWRIASSSNWIANSIDYSSRIARRILRTCRSIGNSTCSIQTVFSIGTCIIIITRSIVWQFMINASSSGSITSSIVMTSVKGITSSKVITSTFSALKFEFINYFFFWKYRADIKVRACIQIITWIIIRSLRILTFSSSICINANSSKFTRIIWDTNNGIKSNTNSSLLKKVQKERE